MDTTAPANQPTDKLDLALLRSYARMTVWSTGQLTPELGQELDRADIPRVVRALERSAAILIEESIKAPEDYPELLLSQAASIQFVIDMLQEREPALRKESQRIH